MITKQYLDSDKYKLPSPIPIAEVTICLDSHENCTSEYMDTTRTYIIKCICYCHLNKRSYIEKENKPLHKNIAEYIQKAVK
jgi:hypothetical protein